MIEVFVSRLGRESGSDSCVVVLQESGGARILPIWIGPAEAASIFEKVHDIKRPRPLTHDLVRSIITTLGASLQRVQITSVEARTYIAELHLERDGVFMNVDARPSDSIAIALRLGAPIFVAEELLVEPDALEEGESEAFAEADETNEGESARFELPEADADQSAEQLKRYLEHLRPEDFGKFNP